MAVLCEAAYDTFLKARQVVNGAAAPVAARVYNRAVEGIRL
jgi:hypothetical protein